MKFKNALAAGAAFTAALGFAAAGQAPAATAPAPDKPAVEKIVHDYLLAHPELLAEMQNALDAKQEAADQKARNEGLAKVGRAALVDPKVAFVTGPADAKVTVAEFFDYRCVH